MRLKNGTVSCQTDFPFEEAYFHQEKVTVDSMEKGTSPMSRRSRLSRIRWSLAARQFAGLLLIVGVLLLIGWFLYSGVEHSL